jgi:hypothetical protein
MLIAEGDHASVEIGARSSHIGKIAQIL